MKDWIRSPSPGGYERPSATAPGASSSSAAFGEDPDDLYILEGASQQPTHPPAAAFRIRRGVVGINLPQNTLRSAQASALTGINAAQAGIGSGSTTSDAGHMLRTTSGGAGGASARAPPSLKSLCLSIVSRNLHQVRDLGFLSYSIARPILEQCQAEQLAEILDNSPHLAPDAETHWKKLCFNDFVQIRKDSEAGRLRAPESWRELYWHTLSEAEEHKAAVAERIKSRYATARAQKDDRKIMVSERPLVLITSRNSAKWTSGMYGASNGGLGGNGRSGANTQGQGMLARAATKSKRGSHVAPPSAGAGAMLAAGRKRKAGPVLCTSPGGHANSGDVIFSHAHKVRVASNGGTGIRSAGSPPRPEQTDSASSGVSPASERRNLAKPGSHAGPITRIVKTVVPTAKAVPPGGLDFFGSTSAGAKVKGSKTTGAQNTRISSKPAAGKFSSPPLSSPPAVVTTHIQLAPQSRTGSTGASIPPGNKDVSSNAAEQPSRKRSRPSAADGGVAKRLGNGSTSETPRRRIAVRGAVD
ncbi:hypothetical protein V8E36_005808 [Tilletia maclaganii]